MGIGGLVIPGLENCDPNPSTKKSHWRINKEENSTHVNDMNVETETIRSGRTCQIDLGALFSFGNLSSASSEMLDKLIIWPKVYTARFGWMIDEHEVELSITLSTSAMKWAHMYVGLYDAE